MSINATLIGQMVAFALFVWFTMKYVWPPITGAMRERQKKISAGLAAAEQGQASMAEATEKADAEMQQAREDAREVISGAHRQATAIVEEARVSAKEEGERIRAAAKSEVDREAAQAREALKKDLAGLVIAGASEIVKREVDATAHADIVDRLAAEL